MVYKSVNDLVPNYMKICLHMCEIHILVQQGLLLRMIYIFQLVNIKELYIQSFAYSGANIWNSINIDIHNQQSLNSFKKVYIKDYLSV